MKAELLARLRDLLGERDLGNGTPLADAAADAIAADAQSAGVTWTQVLALSERELVDAADLLYRNLHGEMQPQQRMPFGTKIEGYGGPFIGGRLLLPEAGNPGLHPYETLRCDAHGPNLDRLLTKLRGSLHPSISSPAPATVVENGFNHYLDFPPFSEAEGVVLRQRVSSFWSQPFCSLREQGLDHLVEEIRQALERLSQDRKWISQEVKGIRCTVQRRLLELYGPAGPVTLRQIAVGWDEQDDEASDASHVQYFQIEYNSLDDALRPGVVCQTLDPDDEVDDPAFQVRDEWKRRSMLKAELAKMGAVGRIDDLAAAIIKAAPEGEQAVLDRLSTGLETQVTIPGTTCDIHTTLTWVNGCILPEIHRTSSLMTETPSPLMTEFRDLRIRGTLPDSAKAAAIGQPLSFIAKLPFPSDGIIVKAIETSNDWLTIKYAEPSLLIDAETGTIRPANASSVLAPT